MYHCPRYSLFLVLSPCLSLVRPPTNSTSQSFLVWFYTCHPPQPRHHERIFLGVARLSSKTVLLQLQNAHGIHPSNPGNFPLLPPPIFTMLEWKPGIPKTESWNQVIVEHWRVVPKESPLLPNNVSLYGTFIVVNKVTDYGVEPVGLVRDLPRLLREISSLLLPHPLGVKICFSDVTLLPVYDKNLTHSPFSFHIYQATFYTKIWPKTTVQGLPLYLRCDTRRPVEYRGRGRKTKDQSNTLPPQHRG